MKNTITLIGEWKEQPHVKVWIDKTGRVCFSPIKTKTEGWNFMASMKVHGELSKTGIEQRLKKRFKKLLDKGDTIPRDDISKATTLLAKRLNQQRFILGQEVMIAKQGVVL